MRTLRPSWCFYKQATFSCLLVFQELVQVQELVPHPASAQEQAQELVQVLVQVQELVLALQPSYSRLQR